MNTSSILKQFSKLQESEEFISKYLVRDLGFSALTKPGLSYLIAKKGDHFFDHTIDVTTLEVMKHLSISEKLVEPEKKRPWSMYQTEGIKVQGPFVWDNYDNLNELSIIVPQIHIEDIVHFYIVDNTNIMHNATKQLFEKLDYSYNLSISTNTYGKLLMLPALNNSTEVVEKLEEESDKIKRNAHNNNSFHEKKKYPDVPILKELFETYKQADDNFRHYVSLLSEAR